MAAAGLPVRGHRHGGGRMSQPPGRDPSTSTPGVDPGAVRWDADGLVVGVVQDVADGRVLMVGWLDVEALAATLGTGLRPLPLAVARPAVAQGRDVGPRPAAPLARPRLRRRRAADRRGSARPDLPPRDALLLRPGRAVRCRPRVRRRDSADARAPPCRRPGLRLARVAVGDDPERAATRPQGSYTVALLDGGVDGVGPQGHRGGDRGPARREERRAGRGRGDADRTETRALLAGEAADLVYHALVLLAERGVEPRAVVDVAPRPPRRGPGLTPTS